MYVHLHACRLMAPQAVRSRFYINPLGEVDVELENAARPLHGRFGQLRFEPEGPEGYRLTCQERAKPRWQLHLKPQDARSLQRLIAEAEDELDALMRDL
ncbi:hypothetical protein [Ferrimonas balearica]|uniref:hypothetical protein n=1 Tax=Ferrimonas balearica TaxID=44012 RepID=UPI001C996910|nr:hypothetical protein [Ferrimonas balearica]MBY5992177.1 hypothetical protein [Ferrimonas balearica]